MKKTICALVFISSALPALAQVGSMSRFRDAADAISKDITLTVESETNALDRDPALDERRFCYSFQSKGHTFAFSMVGKSRKDERDLYHNAGLSRFLYAEFTLSIGGSDILFRQIYRTTAVTQEQIVHDAQEVYALKDKKTRTLADEANLKRLNKEIQDLNALRVDERTFGDDHLRFRMFDPTLNAAGKNRILYVNDKEREGDNPIGELNTHYNMEKSWAIEGRSGVKTLKNLVESGLVDSQSLSAVRISTFGLPVDAWLPGQAPVGATPNRILPNDSIPSFKDNATVVVGKEHLVPDFSPNASNSSGQKGLLDTFMLVSGTQGPLNSQNDYARNADLCIVLPDGTDSATIFPIAGMHEDGRTFGLTWQALPANNGLIVLVQYADEAEPRIGYFDPSGVIAIISAKSIHFGLLMEADKNGKVVKNGIVYWSDHAEKHVSKYKKFSPETTLAPQKSTSSCDVIHSDKPTKRKLVMPRALW